MSQPPGGGTSIAFDRAADYYDETRALPAEVMEGVTDLLADELEGRGRVLEIGVGTGRIALPLHDAGVAMLGLDLSKQMLDKLIENAGGETPFPLLLGDATRLPFATNSLEAAVACHVFHLMPGWKKAADELVRVIDKGGVLLVDLGGWGEGTLHEIGEHWSQQAGFEIDHPGVHEREIFDAAMKERGARVRELEPVVGSRSMTYEKLISQFEAGIWSVTWTTPEDVRKRAADETRRWVQERFGDPNKTFEDEVKATWRAYDLEV